MGEPSPTDFKSYNIKQTRACPSVIITELFFYSIIKVSVVIIMQKLSSYFYNFQLAIYVLHECCT